MKCVKKLGAIFLSAVFIFNSVGPFLKFAILHHRIAREMQNYILYHSGKETYTVTVTPENSKLINWQHQREFSYHGVMFDVMEKVIVDSTTTVYHCIADHKETALFAELDHFIKKHHHPKGHFKISKVQLIHLFPPEIYPEEKSWVNKWDIQVQQCWYDPHFYGSPHLDKISPPPECFPFQRLPLRNSEGIRA